MVSDVVKWLTKWSPAHLSFAMQCTIHLNYLRSGKHTLCGIQRSCESSEKKKVQEFHFLPITRRDFKLSHVHILFLRNSWKINGERRLDTSSRYRLRTGVKLEAWVAVFSPGLEANIRMHATAQAATSSHTYTHTQGKAKSQTGGMSRNYLLLLTNFCLWLMMPSNANISLLGAMRYFMLHYIRQPLLNANLNTEEVTLVSHHLFHRYLASFVLNGRDANPANFYPGTELTQTAADGIITSFPTLPGMSCLANLAVSLFPGLDEACHEVLSWCEDDFSAIRGSTKGV